MLVCGFHDVNLSHRGCQAVPVPQNLLLKDGQLYKHWRTYPFLRILTATGKDEFFFRYEYVRVHFERDATGNLLKSVWQWPQRRPHNIYQSDGTLMQRSRGQARRILVLPDLRCSDRFTNPEFALISKCTQPARAAQIGESVIFYLVRISHNRLRGDALSRVSASEAQRSVPS
jgi:hypothetical protein